MAVWKGSTSEVIRADIDKVWQITGDFAGILNWVNPALEASGKRVSCRISKGEATKPGCIRQFNIVNPDGSTQVVEEQLLEFDPEHYVYKYCVKEHPLLKGYVSTFQLSKVYSDEGGYSGGTLLSWSYEVHATEDPGREAVIKEDVIGTYRACIKALKNLVE